MISSPLRESRLPVGSSARRMGGSFRRPVLFPVQKPDGLQKLGHPLPPPFRVFAIEKEGEFDVLPRRGVGEEARIDLRNQ